MSSFNGYNLDEIIKRLETNVEIELMAQLNELVKRGLLVVEKAEPSFVMCHNSNEVQFSTKVRLVLKDQHYIEYLEEENRTLSEQVENLKHRLKKVDKP